jgi:acetyl esterase/lipase
MSEMILGERVEHPRAQQTRPYFPLALWSRATMWGAQLGIRSFVAAWMAAPDLPWPTHLIDDVARWLPRPRRTQIDSVTLSDCRAEWIRADGVGNSRAILYLHGGAFLTCGLNTHRAVASCLSRSADAPVLNVGYRMLPRHPISTAVADALEGYRWLCEAGYGPDEIVVAGDSAGGYLAFMTALSTKTAGLPKPAGVATISPLTDVSVERVGCRPTHGTMFPPRAATAFTRYLARAHTRMCVDGKPGPLISPVEEDLRDLPPVMIHAGSDELLVGDAELMSDRLHAAGVPCELHLWAGQEHAFAVAADATPESRRAITAIGRFVAHVTSSNTHRRQSRKSIAAVAS